LTVVSPSRTGGGAIATTGFALLMIAAHLARLLMAASP
jgi:hypothetical protein